MRFVIEGHKKVTIEVVKVKRKAAILRITDDQRSVDETHDLKAGDTMTFNMDLEGDMYTDARMRIR